MLYNKLVRYYIGVLLIAFYTSLIGTIFAGIMVLGIAMVVKSFASGLVERMEEDD